MITIHDPKTTKWIELDETSIRGLLELSRRDPAYSSCHHINRLAQVVEKLLESLKNANADVEEARKNEARLAQENHDLGDNPIFED